MGKSSMPCMWCLVMLSVCIDQGDGRWKERDKENLQHDLMDYKRITEKLEREIEAFYDEYPNEWLKGDHVDRIHYKYLTKILNRNTEITRNSENTDGEKHTFPFVSIRTDVTTESTIDTTNRLVRNNSNKFKATGWPTFQDILLAMGTKYDWKNDRWIKVKDKSSDIKTNIKLQAQGNEVSVNEKHKFSYRIVKLKKSKSRRNIVVAVSAVR